MRLSCYQLVALMLASLFLIASELNTSETVNHLKLALTVL